jgi:hypothetical protein
LAVEELTVSAGGFITTLEEIMLAYILSDIAAVDI